MHLQAPGQCVMGTKHVCCDPSPPGTSETLPYVAAEDAQLLA